MKVKKLLKSLRKKLSVFIVLSIVMTTVLPNIGLLSFNAIPLLYAAGTELQPETTHDRTSNKSDSTIYYWKDSKCRVDFKGKVTDNSTYDNGSQVT